MDEISKYRIPEGTSVLVTGATGFTGRVLTRKLVAAGLKVRAIARPTSRLGDLASLPITWIRGEVFHPATVQMACDGVSYIFHVAAAYRESGLAPSDYVNVHVKSTQLLAKAAATMPDFKRFIHISTVGVHGHIVNPPTNEEAPFSPGDIYQETKAEAELWLRSFAKEAGLPYVVLRPAAIMGPGDRRLLKVFSLATKPIFPLLGYGHCFYHLIHVEDLTDIMLLAAVHPEALGEVFICGNEKWLSLEEFGGIVARHLGYRLRPVRIPAWPFFAAAWLCETLCRPLRIAPPLYRRRVAFFTKDRAFDTRKLRERLGFRTSFDNERGIIDTADDYVARGWLRRRG